MARFFATFGQNERSLFTFTASEEPNSLRSFADMTPAGDIFYGIHHFFDYIASSFGHRLTSRTGSGEWSRIGSVLDRAGDADPVETAVLKTVGVLNLLDAADLVATSQSIAQCLAPEFSQSSALEAIDRLVRSGLLFKRPGREDLRLWTSRRVDLSAVWAEAEREIAAHEILRELPKNLSAIGIRKHILARRHSVRTGTNRRFLIRLTHAGSLASYGGHDDADGGVTAIICHNDEDRKLARAWSIEATTSHPELITLVTPRLRNWAQVSLICCATNG